MTQEEKQLLLIDLCARSPYGVMVCLQDEKYGELTGVLDAVYPIEERVIVDELDKAIAPINVRCGGFMLEDNHIKPYLRPLSSMTEEEREEFRMLGGVMSYSPQHNIWAISAFSPEAYDWLNKKMFDYHGLIEKGLALEAPDDMYKTK